MKKLFLLGLVVAVTGFSSIKAQLRAPKFSIGLEVAAPTSDAHNLYSVGFGGSGKIEIPATRQLFITATAGYSSFYLKDALKNTLRTFGASLKPAGFVPLKVGAKYYLIPLVYVEGELGAAIGVQQSATGTNILSGHGTAFAYAPGVGVVVPIIGIDAGVRYEGWSQNGHFDQVALRVAFRF